MNLAVCVLPDVSAKGNVSGTSEIGGLIGYAGGGSIDQAYASGAVAATGYYVGGLIGWQNGGTVTNVWSSGAITGTGTYVGGLVGYQDGGSVAQGLAYGSIGGIAGVGGLVGYQAGGSVTNSVWDVTTTGISIGFRYSIPARTTFTGNIGAPTDAAQSSTNSGVTYGGWNFSTIWTAPTGTAYPTLKNVP